MMKGDKARQFFGPSVLPYHNWYKSKKIDILADRIVVPVAGGRAFKFTRGEAALAHHPLAPEKTGKDNRREREGERKPKCPLPCAICHAHVAHLR